MTGGIDETLSRNVSFIIPLVSGDQHSLRVWSVFEVRDPFRFSSNALPGSTFLLSSFFRKAARYSYLKLEIERYDWLQHFIYSLTFSCQSSQHTWQNRWWLRDRRERRSSGWSLLWKLKKLSGCLLPAVCATIESVVGREYIGCARRGFSPLPARPLAHGSSSPIPSIIHFWFFFLRVLLSGVTLAWTNVSTRAKVSAKYWSDWWD